MVVTSGLAFLQAVYYIMLSSVCLTLLLLGLWSADSLSLPLSLLCGGMQYVV